MATNCAFPGCPVQRIAKYKDMSLFKIPQRKNEFYTKWRKDLVDVLSRYRVMDTKLKQQIMECEKTICFCERHFAPEDMELTKNGHKTLRLEALPTINLPMKSQDKLKTERRQIIRQSEVNDTMNSTRQYYYENFADLCKRVASLKLNDWYITVSGNDIIFKRFSPPCIVPNFKVTVDESLEFTIVIFGWLLPDDHVLYKKHYRSVRNITISELLKNITHLNLCPGVHDMKSKDLISHIVPCDIDTQVEYELPFQTIGYERSKDCLVLHEEDRICLNCEKIHQKHKKFQKAKSYTPVHPNTPLSKTNPEQIIMELKEQRKEVKELRNKLTKMENEIKLNSSVIVDEELGQDIFRIMDDNSESMSSISPFMKLFWEQQKKLFGKGTGVRYHPMIIRFCLSLASKSASTYDELRSSNVLTLPSRRTLRDYKNAVKPEAGFNPEVIQELIKVATPLKDHQRYVVLSFDEMKIKENLVYDKYTGQLTGYVDLGDPELNFSSFKHHNVLATHVLVFYIRGIASYLKFELGYFGTKDVTAHQIMLTFWRAVSILEDTCKLPVIAVVSDGASSNRAFYKMHNMMDGNINNNKEVIYRTINIYAPERYIWFFADAPHLMKTMRNCVQHSGNGKTRLMWNDGKDILWSHISKVAFDESMHGLKLIPKISEEHVRLTPYSRMNVRLAVQVLSESVSNILYEYYPDAHGTAELCLYMDKFFDCLNVRNRKEEGEHKRKEFLLAYENHDDKRFTWLLGKFLPYLKKWKESIESREGNFLKKDKSNMFISHQTYEGLLITVYSVIEVVRYLLKVPGVEFVLTERFNQDVLEENFGRHRCIGRRNENPSLFQFGYDSNTTRMQRSIAPVTGNTKGGHKQKRHVSWSIVDDAPLSKKNTKSDQY